jgi:hypothetical protein
VTGIIKYASSISSSIERTESPNLRTLEQLPPSSINFFPLGVRIWIVELHPRSVRVFAHFPIMNRTPQRTRIYCPRLHRAGSRSQYILPLRHFIVLCTLPVYLQLRVGSSRMGLASHQQFRTGLSQVAICQP